eukprot:c19152_g1_i1.p1 GENE.c19152_g1_i1~~c19152_g1_i1.p1  ORF type:complete len:551 (+),score=120.48 c19152_g1_i1:1094-2746(+)
MSFVFLTFAATTKHRAFTQSTSIPDRSSQTNPCVSISISISISTLFCIIHFVSSCTFPFFVQSKTALTQAVKKAQSKQTQCNAVAIESLCEISKILQKILQTNSKCSFGAVCCLTSSDFILAVRKVVAAFSMQESNFQLYQSLLELVQISSKDPDVLSALTLPPPEISTLQTIESFRSRTTTTTPTRSTPNAAATNSSSNSSTTTSVSIYEQLKSLDLQSEVFLKKANDSAASSASNENALAHVIRETVAFVAARVAETTPSRKRQRIEHRTTEYGSDEAFIQELTPHAMSFAALLPAHYFNSIAANEHASGGHARSLRINKELSSLATSLPITRSSSVFVAVDENNTDVLRAAIIPSPDTPYGLAPFLFDIYLPPTYPNVPPKVQFMTTGGGKVRFNPNLYNDGKVCLSLLGTWAGPSWSNTSTLLQVLISIQSLIFVEDPYFNEPGFESTMNTPQGKKQSTQYNLEQRINTLSHALIPSLQLPPYPFQNILEIYFRYQHSNILHLLNQWSAEAQQASVQTGVATETLCELVRDLLKKYPAIDPIISID